MFREAHWTLNSLRSLTSSTRRWGTELCVCERYHHGKYWVFIHSSNFVCERDYTVYNDITGGRSGISQAAPVHSEAVVTHEEKHTERVLSCSLDSLHVNRCLNLSNANTLILMFSLFFYFKIAGHIVTVSQRMLVMCPTKILKKVSNVFIPVCLSVHGGGVLTCHHYLDLFKFIRLDLTLT